MLGSKPLTAPEIPHLSPAIQEDFAQKLDRVMEGFSVLPLLPKTILITGGYKYGELSMKDGEVMSDLDVYILSNWFPLYWRRLVRAQDRLNEAHGFFFHYRGMFPWLFRHSQTYWGFRMREESIVLRGDAQALASLCPHPHRIQDIESVRMMCSTLVLWVYNGEVQSFDMEQPHLVARVYLNLAEALVTHAGQLTPSYRARKDAFTHTASSYAFLDDTLKRRMQDAYLSKVDADAFYATGTFDHITFTEAKHDCVRVLSSFLKEGISADSREAIWSSLKEQERVKPLFFAAYWWRLKQHGFSPSLSLIWRGSLVDLFALALAYAEERSSEEEERMRLYTGSTTLTKEALVKLFELVTIPVIVDL